MYIYTKIVDGKRVLYGTTADVPASTDLPVKYFKNDWSVISDIGDYTFFYDNQHQIYGNTSTTGIPTGSDLAIYPYVEGADGTLTPIISAVPGGPTVSLNKEYIWVPNGKSETLIATVAPSAATLTWEAKEFVGEEWIPSTYITVTSSGVVTNTGKTSGTATIFVTATFDGKTSETSCQVGCSTNAVEFEVLDGQTPVTETDGKYVLAPSLEHNVGVSIIINDPSLTIVSWNDPQDTGFTWQYTVGATVVACTVSSDAASGTSSTATFTDSNDVEYSVVLEIGE